MDNNEKKVPRTVRDLDTSRRRIHFNDKIINTTKEVGQQRLEICKQCSQLEDWGCLTSGFFMPRQVRLKAAHCPLGKWSYNYSAGRKPDGKNN